MRIVLLVPTRIAFAGGESILVAEELTDVVAALEGHTADTPALPAFTRKAGHSEAGGPNMDGQPVHVRPGAVIYVSAS